MAKRSRKAELSDQVVLRMEPKLRRAIKSAAEQDRRPMAHLIRNILSDWVAGRPLAGGDTARAA
jgi:hypothetical protein